MNQETLLIYRGYQYCLRQQKLQLVKTFCDYEPESHLDSSDSIFLPIYLNGTTIVPTTRDVT